jgi:hypothetical protein
MKFQIEELETRLEMSSIFAADGTTDGGSDDDACTKNCGSCAGSTCLSF